MERPSSDELISAYFDDETTPEENVVVDRLLADPKHRQALEEYRQLREELRSMPALKLDAGWSARLKHRLDAAKPEWTGKADGSAKDAAVLSAMVRPPLQAAASGGAERPMPASLDYSRGDGYSRFRHLWLTAGVGVAAGTLGLVIGWSAQLLSPADVAYETGAAAPTVASPEAISDRAFEPMVSLEAESQGVSAGAAADFAMNGEMADVAAKFESSGDFATPPVDEAASAPEPWSAEVGGLENAQRMSRTASVPSIPGLMQGAAGVADAEGNPSKTAEKEFAEAAGAMPPLELAVASPVDPSALRQEHEGLDRERLHEEGKSDRDAVYVGVWNPTGDDLSADQLRGVMRQIDAYADRTRRADDASGQEREESLGTEAAPALVLDGSPEHVAAALEVLASDRSRGEVRLLDRVDGAEESSYYERSRRLSERQSRLQRHLAVDERESARRKEDWKDEVANGDRYTADDETRSALAFSAVASPIDRIEAFFFDDAASPGSLAEGVPSNDMLAGGYGSGGSGAGGFGGIGGGAIPSAAGSGPAPVARPAITGPFAEAAPADAPVARDANSDLAAGAAPAATRPAASRVRSADLARTRGGAAPPEPGIAPRSGPAGGTMEAAGIAAPEPRPPLAMAGQPAPPAPAPGLADATPPPPAEAEAPSRAPGAAGEGGAIGKSNRLNEGAAFGASPVPPPSGIPAEGEPEADAVRGDRSAPPDAMRSEVEMAERKLAAGSLQEAIGSAASEDRPWFEDKLLAPAPRRVRVILFASENSIPQLPVTGVPSGPAAAVAPATPAAPAATKPAEEAVPAGSAPDPER